MRIALLQMRSGIDPAANARILEQAIEDAAAGGAVMLFTPEMSGLLDRDRTRSAASIVGEREDIVLRRVQEAARSAKLWVHLGSLAIAGGEGHANRGFVIDGEGEVRARYDKLHMFDIELGQESWRESAAFRAGSKAVVIDTPLGPLGLAICYDLRFPALFNALSEAGAQILSIPAAFTVPTGHAHWHVLMRARAIENACFVVAAAQSGCHEDGRETFGHSLVIGPWGDILLDMGEGERLAFCNLDLGAVAQTRQRVPVLTHRRPVPRVVRV